MCQALEQWTTPDFVLESPAGTVQCGLEQLWPAGKLAYDIAAVALRQCIAGTTAMLASADFKAGHFNCWAASLLARPYFKEGIGITLKQAGINFTSCILQMQLDHVHPHLLSCTCTPCLNVHTVGGAYTFDVCAQFGHNT